MGFLQEMLETIKQTEQVHDSFRCWLTTEPHAQFSINILQSSTKYTLNLSKVLKVI